MQAGQIKVCPQCGRQVPIESAHCAFCGHAFRTRFAAPQYGPGEMAFATDGFRATPKKQLGAKWAIGLLTAGCMAAAIFLVFKSKYPDADVGGPIAGSGVAGAPIHAIVPTSILNQQALSSTSKITINWAKSDAGQTMGEVTNNSAQALPNLYLQFLVKNGTGDVWAGPYQIVYQPPGFKSTDWIPPDQSVSFTVPVEFSNIERLHAYYVQDSPAGPVQYAVAVDQTQDADK